MKHVDFQSYYRFFWVAIEADESEAHLFALFSQRDRAGKRWSALKQVMRNSFLLQCHGENQETLNQTTEKNCSELRGGK